MAINGSALQTEKPRFTKPKICFLAWALLVTFFTSAQSRIDGTADPGQGELILSLQTAVEGAQNEQALALELSHNVTGTHDQMALQDCLQLFEDTLHRLNGSLNSTKTSQLENPADVASVHTWISAALTNQHMCLDGFSGTNYKGENNSSINLSDVGSSISVQVSNVSRLISASLALFTSLYSSSPAAPGKRRLLSYGEKMGFPEWVSGDQRRRLLQSGGDVVVSKDGWGDYTTITEAVNAYAPPQGNKTYYVIYIAAGRYYENIVIGSNMTNLMMIGAGMDQTFVLGNRSIGDSKTLYGSATFGK
ncbi:probable pectinesterase/pectinesterase inhibitor 40 [Cryptomeria japonica]|uniref:probable pectinesterase/pectinesterase inhibitor 40 n=1 Tax=Cryptomeria japonica TaxID=3369 RepID=UPI0027D9FA10|nr:probable pectinesterase/pectinesterase inhibitor 40 [Cryptomeria japonica]